MILRTLCISILLLGLTPIKSAANARAYIADSDYLKYRQQLVANALNDPTIKERINNARTIDEINEILKMETEEKLKKYREEHGLDVNGATKE